MCPLVTPDFSEVTENAQIPEGEYKAHIVDAETKVSQKGNPYVRWQLTLFGCDDTKLNGRPVWTSTPTSGKGAFRLQQLYTAATGDKPTGAFDTHDLMGKTVLITVVNGTDQDGKPSGYSDVKAVKKIA